MARPPEYSPAAGHRGPSRPPVVLCPMMELLEQFRARYPFPLDDLQREAIRAIEAGQSVIVSAPTGARKTLVAEFAIQMALATGKRIAYTTPLKALSNQKFNDFTRTLGAETVGILTGDVKVNPHGRVLVMTTEILRNALYGSGLDDLGYIVLGGWAPRRAGPTRAAAGTRAGWWIPSSSSPTSRRGAGSPRSTSSSAAPAASARWTTCSPRAAASSAPRSRTTSIARSTSSSRRARPSPSPRW